jgi:hypothetical protein
MNRLAEMLPYSRIKWMIPKADWQLKDNT